MTLSVAERLLLQDLKRRMEAVELALAANRAPLQTGNAQRKDAGAHLRDLIRVTGETEPKRALQALARAGIEPLPKLRTVQNHLALMRKADGPA